MFNTKERNMMEKESISNGVQGAQQKVIAAQNLANQFNKGDTELALDENVQEGLAKSQQYQAKNQQPTYEPNKPF
jgi:competence protein ComGC